MTKFPPNSSIHDLIPVYAPIIANKAILTTGVSPGSLGHVFVQAVAAAAPRLLILAGRDAAKLAQTAEAITAVHPDVETRALVVDLASLSSVRRAAGVVNSWGDVPCVDVVVNNAGVMAVEFVVTEDGIETQFAAGHVGHFLLTNLIMEKVLAAGEPRVVNVASDGHRLGGIRWADVNFSVSLLLSSRPSLKHLPDLPLLNISQPLATNTTTERRNIQQMDRLRPSQNRKHALLPLPRH